MKDDFRLLEVSGEFGRNSQSGGAATIQTVSFSPSQEQRGAAPWVSIVIGKNGIGKSRLLAGIADLLSGEPRRRISHGISSVSYQVGSKECRLTIDQTGRVEAYIDGVRHERSDLPLPTKVIALTTTPFDKFLVPRLPFTSPDYAPHEAKERYSYIGLRDRTGRASPTAVIFRALEGLFGASRSVASRRERIADVFRFLGYEPRVDVRYRPTISSLSKLKQIISGDVGDILPEYTNIQIHRLIERDPSFVSQIRHTAKELLYRLNDQREIILRADFQGHTSGEDEEFFRAIQVLRRINLVKMSAVEVQRLNNGAVFDLKLASSGELGIVTGILGLSSVIEDNSLIFIDEPEISLHPEWQAKYVDLLLQTFGGYKGCHFIIATHSPLILSDISPDNSTVAFMDADRQGTAFDAEDFSGRSSDHLLATAFQSPGKNNLYLKQELIKALRLAADGKAMTAEFEETLNGMVRLLPSLDVNSPTTELIHQLQLAKLEATR